MRRQLGRRRHALTLDELVELGLAIGQPCPATLLHPIAATKAQRQCQVQQLQQVQVPRRIACQPIEQVEDLGAAIGFAVERHQQSALRPAAGLAQGAASTASSSNVHST